MLPTVTQILGVYADFSQVKPDVLEAACDRGTAVHRYCHLYAVGEYAMVPVGFEGYCSSFRTWFDEMVVEVIAAEVELIDPILGYVGHPDLIAVLKGDKQPTVTDYKTPTTHGKLWAAQCAAYMKLAERWNPCRCASVRLRADGGRALFKDYSTSDQDFQAFKLALWSYQYFKS